MCRGTAFSPPPVICEQRYELPFIPNVISMLRHQKNLCVLRGRQWAGRGEAWSLKHVKFIKNHPVPGEEYSYEAPHYEVFSNLVSLHLSSVQIFF
jgi:hypothetical protein